MGHYLSSLGSSDIEEYPRVPLLTLRREDCLLGEILTSAGSSVRGLMSTLAWSVNPELNLQPGIPLITMTLYIYPTAGFHLRFFVKGGGGANVTTTESRGRRL